MLFRLVERFNTIGGKNGRTRHYNDHYVNASSHFNDEFKYELTEEEYEEDADALALTPVSKKEGIYACQDWEKPDRIAKYDESRNEFVKFKIENGEPIIFTYFKPNADKGFGYYYGRQLVHAKKNGLRILKDGEVY